MRAWACVCFCGITLKILDFSSMLPDYTVDLQPPSTQARLAHHRISLHGMLHQSIVWLTTACRGAQISLVGGQKPSSPRWFQHEHAATSKYYHSSFVERPASVNDQRTSKVQHRVQKKGMPYQFVFCAQKKNISLTDALLLGKVFKHKLGERQQTQSSQESWR